VSSVETQSAVKTGVGAGARRRRAIISGGSLGGLLAANMLRSIGWDVEVFERAGDDLASRGAGIGTHDELFAILRRANIVVDDSIGVLPLSRICLDMAGDPIAEIKRPRVLSSWGRLYRALKDALPEQCYHFSKSFVSYEESATDVTAHFSDGTHAAGDLLIGADGIRSAVRNQFNKAVQPRYAGYVAWRGMMREADMPADLHRRVFDYQIMSVPEGQNVVAYPVPGADNDVRPGSRAYNFVWYYPVDAATLRDLSTDTDGRYHEYGIPPPLIRPQFIAEARALARKCLPAQFADVIELTPQVFFQAIFDLESPCLGRGRVAVIGDAAFVARPHVAMGVTKAALDAESLADALAWAGDDMAAALARYDQEQGEFGRRVVARARYLGAHVEAQHKPRELRTGVELDRDPKLFMLESGARLCDIPDLFEIVQKRQARRELEAA